MRAAMGVLLLGLVGCGGGGSTSVPDIGVPPGQACSDVIEVPQQGVQHVPAGEPVRYATDPPTSGSHWSAPGRAPVPTGIYTEPVPDEATVHNLEHGHVVVHHDGLPADAVEAIAASVRTDPVMTVMAPRPGMAWTLALTAWNRIQVCDELPSQPIETVRSFVRAHRDDAPESIP